MGTPITLCLNDIQIDWGTGDFWRAHHWLFPQGSLQEIEYRHDDGDVETMPAFQTALSETLFRLQHLGYSERETEEKFHLAVQRWNRRSELRLTFADFHAALTGVDFASLTSADLEPYIWDFRDFTAGLLARWDTDEAGLNDFVRSLDFSITLRVLADRASNGPLLLIWNHHPFVEAGWATLEDLTDIDRQMYVANHTVLFGRLQDFARRPKIAGFDNWLAENGIPQTTPYVQEHDGRLMSKKTTLPTAVRNMIHHPENSLNRLSDDDLRASVELLLGLVQRLPAPGLPIV